MGDHSNWTASKDTTIRIWRAGADGSFTLDQLLDRAAGGHVDEVEPLAFALGGALLVSGGHDQVVKVWGRGNDDRFALVETLEHAEEVESAAVSRDGLLIVAGGEDGTIRVWERTASGAYQVLASFTGHDGAAHSIAFLPDGRRFVSVGSGAVRFWAPDGTLLGDYDQEMGTGQQAVALSPDGALFAYARTDATVSVAFTPALP